MGGHFVLLAAFLMEPHPPALSLGVVVADVHVQGGRDAGEGVGQQRDQRAIAQTDRRRHVDALEELPRLIVGEDRRLATRATATIARRSPRRLATAMPQAFSADHRWTR